MHGQQNIKISTDSVYDLNLSNPVYEEKRYLVHGAVYSGRFVPEFQRNALSQSPKLYYRKRQNIFRNAGNYERVKWKP